MFKSEPYPEVIDVFGCGIRAERLALHCALCRTNELPLAEELSNGDHADF